MSSGDALGIVEVVGAVPAVAAADAMLKAASIELVSRSRVGADRVALTIKGDIASVTAALGAGVEAAKGLGAIATSAALGRPAPEVGAMAARAQGPAVPASPAARAAAADPSAAPAKVPARATGRSGSRARAKPAAG